MTHSEQWRAEHRDTHQAEHMEVWAVGGIGEVETQAQSTNPKLEPLPEAPQDVEALIFTTSPDSARCCVSRSGR